MAQSEPVSQPQRRRRRWRWVALAIVLLLVAVYSAGWFWAQQKARATVEGFLARSNPDMTIDVASYDVTGFPLSLTLASTGLKVTDARGGAWSGEGVDVSVVPWRLPDVDIRLAAPQRIDLPGDVPLAAEMKADGTGTIGFGLDGQVHAVVLTLPQLELTGGPLPQPLPIGAARIEAAQPGEAPDAAASLAIDLTGVAIPAPLPDGVARVADAMGGAVSVLGPLPRAADAAAMAAWRDAGGKLRIDRLGLAWAGMTVKATGELALDEDLQPAGTITVEIHGWQGALDAAQAAHLLPDTTIQQARAGLQLFSGTNKDDAGPVASVSLAIQDRKVSAMFFTVATLPEIRWPG
jgi:hypothetical protein